MTGDSEQLSAEPIADLFGSREGARILAALVDADGEVLKADDIAGGDGVVTSAKTVYRNAYRLEAYGMVEHVHQEGFRAVMDDPAVGAFVELREALLDRERR